MGKSFQKGWVVLRGKKWHGYYRRTALDSETGKPKCKVKTVVLGLKARLGKSEARETLQREIEKATGASAGRNLSYDGSVTVGWFVRNRYYPLKRQDWSEETARSLKSSLQKNFLDQFGDVPLENIDTYTLQLHLGNLASHGSKSVVKHIRLYIRAIFREAVDQHFLSEDPTRRLKLPKALRESDRTTLTWEQLRMVLATVDGWVRLLLETDFTLALRPGELFALTWGCLDPTASVLRIKQTVYVGKIRARAKTAGSLADLHVPPGLMDKFLEWKQHCPDPSPNAFIFHNKRRGIPSPNRFNRTVFRKIAQDLGLPKLNFQVIRRTIATIAQRKGSVKDAQGLFRHSTPHMTAGTYMQIIPEGVDALIDSIYLELTGTAPPVVLRSKSDSRVIEESKANISDASQRTTSSRDWVATLDSPKDNLDQTIWPDHVAGWAPSGLSANDARSLPTHECSREDSRAYPPTGFDSASRFQDDGPRAVLVREDQLGEAETSRQPYSREELYEDVWANPMTTVAPRYGLSDRGLRKVCDRLQVPVPPMGYWNKRAAGKRVPLRPDLRPLQIINRRRTRQNVRYRTPEKREPIAAQTMAMDRSIGQKGVRDAASGSDAPMDQRENRVYSMTDIALKSRQIFEAVEGGETLLNACGAEGIHDATYHEWRKRSRNPDYPFWDDRIATAQSECAEYPAVFVYPKWLPCRPQQHTKEEIAVILNQVNEAVAAGDTIRAVCRRVDIDVSTYYGWLRRSRKVDAGSAS